MDALELHRPADAITLRMTAKQLLDTQKNNRPGSPAPPSRGPTHPHRKDTEGRRCVPSLQLQTNHWIRRRRAPGRRDSLLRRKQGPIEVWSRLWPSTIVGRRSYWNTLALVRDVSKRMDFVKLPLIVTDGFDFYEKSVTESVASSGKRLSMVRSSRRAGTIAS